VHDAAQQKTSACIRPCEHGSNPKLVKLSERDVVPIPMPAGLADGLGLESAPESVGTPAPRVLQSNFDHKTLGSPHRPLARPVSAVTLLGY